MSPAHASAALAAARASLSSDPARAFSLAQQMLARSGNDIDALEVAAMAQARLGRTRDAQATYRRIITLDPRARWARDDLARLLLAAGQRDEAETEIRLALAADEGDANAHALIATLLAEREQLVEAQHHFERAVALAGRHPELLANLGRVRMRRGDLGTAAQLAAEAATLDPTLLAAAVLGAEAAEQGGNDEAALQWLDRAEPLAARRGTDVAFLRARILAGGRDWAQALALLDASAETSGAARLLRGRLREKAGRFAEAWSDFVTGKTALARPHDPADLIRRLDQLTQADWPPSSSAEPQRGPQPLFVLGAPRSGTTMVEQVLAAHSRIVAGGELPFVAEMARHAESQLGPDWPLALGRLATQQRDDLIATLRERYFARAAAWGLTSTDAAFFTDKMPLNETWLPLVRQVFPASPLVLVERHPLDVLLSAMSQDMTHGGNAFYDPCTAARFLAETGRFVSLCADRFGIVPHRLRYESFVIDPEAETRTLMSAVGLPVEPAQARFHMLPRYAPTPSYAQVREPLHARSVGRWRPFADQLEPFRPILADLINEGGYAA